MVEGAAAAVLPLPAENGVVVAARLQCSEQRWSLMLEPAEGRPMISGPVTIAVDGESFATSAAPQDREIAVTVPHAALEKIRSGIRLTIRLFLHGDDVIFNLRGSRRAVEAAAPLCSPRDMSAFDQVLPSAGEADMALVTALRADDIKAFRAATSSEPEIRAGTIAPGGRKVIFGQLCGSSWYFGRTGCNIAGFAAGPGPDDWKRIFDGEGRALYADPKAATAGWPALIAVSQRPEAPDIVWRWNGTQYEFLREDAPQ